MKNAVLILLTVLVLSCASVPQQTAEVQPEISYDFSQVMGKEWKLIEVQIDGEDIGFNREALLRDDFGDIFTISFDADTVSGTGAPNRYSAPYTQDRDTLHIGLARSTLMASFREPEHLKEHEFYAYIQNTHNWILYADNTFVLSSKTDDGKTVVLRWAAK